MACIGLLGNFLKLYGLEIPESRLAFLTENLGDLFPHSFLDDLVDVHEAVAEALVQFAPDGGFSASHEADQNDVLRCGF